MGDKSAMQQFIDWLMEEWYNNPDFTVSLYTLIDDKAKDLLYIEEKQLQDKFLEGMKKSDSIVNFMYSEVEGKVETFHNSRHVS